VGMKILLDKKICRKSHTAAYQKFYSALMLIVSVFSLIAISKYVFSKIYNFKFLRHPILQGVSRKLYMAFT